MENAKLPYEMLLWTDSSIVLGWLQKSPNSLKTFVENRVPKIMSITSNSNRKHVKTENNPEDLDTRGCTPDELIETDLWWHGPTWLSESCKPWSEPKAIEPTDIESKKVSTYHLNVSLNDNGKNNTLLREENEDVLKRVSSFGRALRVISCCFRFINRVLKSHSHTESFINSKEIKFTKSRLIYLAKLNYRVRHLTFFQLVLIS